MKTRRSNLLLLGAISLTLANPFVIAANLYWDTNGTTAGSGAATGTWGTDVFWNTDVTGVLAPSITNTAGVDDLFFSAGTTGTGGTVTLGANQSAKSLTFEEGAVTLTGSTLTLIGGGITVNAGAGTGNATISSNLTLNGNNIFNVGSGRTLTLSTGTFTRGTRATVNIQGLGSGSSTMTGLSTNTNNIIGPWASIGTGASTTYAKFNGSSITGLGYTGTTDGTSVASAGSVVTGAGNLNYTLSAAGTLGASASVNTLRYTGGAGTLTASTGFTTRGLMNVSGNTLALAGSWTSGASTTEMVVNTANGDISVTGGSNVFTGTITKTGSGTFTLGSGAAHSVGAWTVNQGILEMSSSAGNALPSGTITPGGTMRFGASNKFDDAAAFTINAGGTLDIKGLNDTIGGLSGSGTVTGTSGGYIQLAEGNTFSGNITGAIGIRTSATTSDQILSGASDYSGGTIINAGFLQLANSTAAGSGTIQLGATSGTNTAELRLAGSGTNVANALTVNAGSSGIKTLANRSTNTIIYSGDITANDNLTILANMSGTSNAFTISGTANNIAAGKTVAFSSTGPSTGSVTDNAVWSGDGSISYTSNNTGGFIISGPKTYTGGATLGAMTGAGVVAVTSSSTGPANAPTSGLFGTGTLSIGATKMRAGTSVDITIGNAINFTANPTFTTVADEKSLIFKGNASLGANRTLIVETGSTVTNEAVEFSGEISGSGFGINKEGAGRLVLSGTNSYTGATTVSAGTLFVTGSLASDVTVSENATLGGGGTVGAASFAGGSFFDIALALGGSPNPLDATNISFSTAGFGIDNLRYNGAAVDWSSIADGDYTLITGTLNSSNLDNFGFANAFDIDGINGTRTAYFENGSLKLVVIPEPRAALLAGLGLLALLRRRRC